MIVNTSTKNNKVKNATWIQGIGHVFGKLASEIKINDFIVLNGGFTYKVLSVVNETKKFITFEILSSNKEVFEKRFKKNIVIGID